MHIYVYRNVLIHCSENKKDLEITPLKFRYVNRKIEVDIINL